MQIYQKGMTSMKDELTLRIGKLLAVRSIVTLIMTVGMLLLLSGVFSPPDTIMTLYSTSYGAIITYFFTKEKEESL